MILDDGISHNVQYSNIIYPFASNSSGAISEPIFDTPAIELTSTKRVQTNQQFTAYLMFKPSTPNSIWVTLRLVNWNWRAVAVLGSDGIWTLENSNNTGYLQSPVSISSSGLPLWEDYASHN